MNDKTYEEMTNYVLDELFPKAVGRVYNDKEITEEQWNLDYEKFHANFHCACDVRDEWYSPEGLIDHWELNPECYSNTRQQNK